MNDFIFDKFDIEFFNKNKISDFILQNFKEIYIESPITISLFSKNKEFILFIIDKNYDKIDMTITRKSDNISKTITDIPCENEPLLHKIFITYVRNINMVQKQILLSTLDIMNELTNKD